MTPILDDMDHDQLLIAAFFSTPLRGRFLVGKPEPSMSAPERFGQMSVKGLRLADFDDAGLRSYIDACLRPEDEDALMAFKAAYDRATRNAAEKVA